MQGVPIRIELGPKDIKQKQVVAVRRDTGEKLTLQRDTAVNDILHLLETIHCNMLEKWVCILVVYSKLFFVVSWITSSSWLYSYFVTLLWFIPPYIGINYYYDVHILTHCHDKSTIQQEENSFHQQIKLKFKAETSKLLHLEHSFLWCWNFDASENRSEMCGKFWNVVLEKDREDQLDR